MVMKLPLYLTCNKDYSNNIDKKFYKRFKSTFKFSCNNIHEFTLLLKKGVYPYENMDD